MYRFIPFDFYDPYFKTSLNELGFDFVKKTGEGIVWINGWSCDCVNIGYSQDVNLVLNVDEVKKRKIKIVRRQSGGGTTFLKSDGEITWSIIGFEKDFPNDINQIYVFVCSKIIDVLSKLNIDSKHKIINDVITDNGKISGATLRKKDGLIYVAGTLIYKTDKELMNLILKPENDDLKKEKILEVDKKITSISKENPNVSFNNVVDVLSKVFFDTFNCKRSSWTEDEIAKANKLVERYSSNEWIYSR